MTWSFDEDRVLGCGRYYLDEGMPAERGPAPFLWMIWQRKERFDKAGKECAERWRFKIFWSGEALLMQKLPVGVGMTPLPSIYYYDYEERDVAIPGPSSRSWVLHIIWRGAISVPRQPHDCFDWSRGLPPKIRNSGSGWRTRKIDACT